MKISLQMTDQMPLFLHVSSNEVWRIWLYKITVFQWDSIMPWSMSLIQYLWVTAGVSSISRPLSQRSFILAKQTWLQSKVKGRLEIFQHYSKQIQLTWNKERRSVYHTYFMCFSSLFLKWFHHFDIILNYLDGVFLPICSQMYSIRHLLHPTQLQ